ncbi:Glycosyltransferase involved in cell wall bisynthesis [Streptosporangium canum]|uniref:Glycosyltransferase involved in cell wall bisynthesis n=2 Tax=Streptosporangium canum TaxID=324952 RepID=A0A1I3LFR6_9ACTN|nr:Glycosyltransferase involved in cell wall bisynthesis [Streptosporangium canum]
MLLIGQLRVGGTEKQVFLLATGLFRSGVAVDVVTLHSDGPYRDALELAGVHVHNAGFTGMSMGPMALPRNLLAAVRLIRLIRRLRPDVLHAFLYHGYVIGAPIAWLARVPVVVAGRRSLSDFKRARRWVYALERVATRLTRHVVANAVAVAEDTRRVEGIVPGKLSVIYNGLPESAFVPGTPARIVTDLPVVCCVANLKTHKGHRFLIEAVALLAARGTPCTLVLAGEGPERDALLRQAANLGVDLRLLGLRRDIEALMNRASAVVLASLYEGMSNAVMEAMAAGKPIVATAVGGTRELLSGRGLLVPPADPPALADALERVLRDPHLSASLGVAARAWAMDNLGVDSMIDRHLVLYRRLLEERCAG